MTKKVLRIKGCIYYDVSVWTPKKIVAFLEKNGLYGVTIVADMAMNEVPNTWKPKQKILNGFVKTV